MFEITIFCLYNLSLSILWDRTSDIKVNYLFPYYAHINDQYKYNLENQKSFSYKMAFLWIKNKVLYWLSIFFLVIVVVTAVVIFWTKKILVSVYTANYMLCYPPQSTQSKNLLCPLTLYLLHFQNLILPLDTFEPFWDIFFKNQKFGENRMLRCDFICFILLFWYDN